eukprot:403354799
MSISSVSTAASQQSTKTKESSQSSGKSWNILKSLVKTDKNQQVLIESPPLANMFMEQKLTKLNSRFLTAINQSSQQVKENKICFSCDSYQGLFALQSQPGLIEISDFTGARKTRVQIMDQQNQTYQSIKFYPNRPYILAIDEISKRISLINYSNSENQTIKVSALQKQEYFTCLYIPEFYIGQDANEDYAFLGTNQGNIFVFSLDQKAIISQILCPQKLEMSVSDIMSNHKKPHRLLICYKSNETASSFITVHSLYKNKEVQRLDFNQNDQGQALTATYNHEANRIAVVFTSGKILIFKAQSSGDKNQKCKPLQAYELSNTSELTSAKITWKNSTDSINQILVVQYSFNLKKKESMTELQVFTGAKGTKNHRYFDNQINVSQISEDNKIVDVGFIDLMIPNQNQNISDQILQFHQKSKKQDMLKLRSSKQILIKSQLILALNNKNELFYATSDDIIKQKQFKEDDRTANKRKSIIQLNQDMDNESQNIFKLLPSFVGNHGAIKYQVFIETTTKNSKDFIDHIENLALMGRREQLYELSKTDQRFQKCLNKKDAEKYATTTELISFMQSYKKLDDDSAQNIIGYMFVATSLQELKILRVSTQNMSEILRIDLKQFIFDDRVTSLYVDKRHKRILISLSNSVTCEVILQQTLIKTDKFKTEMQVINVEPLSIRDIDPNEKITVTKTAYHNQRQNLLIQGFSNGRLKITNLKSNKIVFNVRCMNDDSAISCIETQSSSSGDQINIVCGTSNGCMVQICLNNKETKIVKSKQISLFKIKFIILTENHTSLLYVLTEKQLFALDKQTFSIKFKYELNPKDVSQKEKFKTFSLMKLTEGKSAQYSIACLLQKSKWMLMFDAETLIGYCVYDLNKSGLNPNQIYTLSGIGQNILTVSSNLQTQIFTLKRHIEFDNETANFQEIYDEQLAQQKFPKSSKKSVIVSIFHKNITIKKCLNSQMKDSKLKKRSLSVGDSLHSNQQLSSRSRQSQDKQSFQSSIRQSSSNLYSDEGDSENSDSPKLRKKKINQMNVLKESRVKKGFAILFRNQRQSSNNQRNNSKSRENSIIQEVEDDSEEESRVTKKRQGNQKSNSQNQQEDQESNSRSRNSDNKESKTQRSKSNIRDKSITSSRRKSNWI